MKNSLVSVIMSAYNSSAFIAAAIESVLKQTYKNIELIIINDGSTDSTEEVIQSFHDLRIRYFCQANEGQCAASNLGITHAKGDYIKFFDADDVMNSEHIEYQLFVLNNSTTDIASCAWGRFYDGDPASTIFIEEPIWHDMYPIDWLKTSLSQRTDMMSAWIWLIPKQILEKAGGWNESLSLNNDFEFSVRLLLQTEKVLFTREAKLYYRSGRTGSLSVSHSKKVYEDAYLSTFLGCSYILKVENTKLMQRLCANRYQEWIYRIYPKYPQLLNVFQEQINQLGGSDIKPEGGLLFRILCFFIGWKFAKRIQQVYWKCLNNNKIKSNKT